ncbi:MAG: MTAP family purine nucleoside phosphorylase [Candidatus Hodarchaeota archaeon]
MEKYPRSICVIGGSGFYSFLRNPAELTIPTPFSKTPVLLYRETYEDKILYFLPRHGGNHSIPPHKINFKANIFALHLVGVSRVIATSAVGSLIPSLKVGNYVLIDQFIDFIRPITFFDGDFTLEFANGLKLSGVVHVDMTKPYCSEIRDTAYQVLKNDNTHYKGTYFTTMGPRFETSAEIKALQHLGATVVGMTNSSEAILCREIGICYGVIAVVTNMAAGLQTIVNQQEVLDIFKSRLNHLNTAIPEIILKLPDSKSCSCETHILKT